MDDNLWWVAQEYLAQEYPEIRWWAEPWAGPPEAPAELDDGWPDMWPFLQSVHGQFHVEGPLSAAMKAFLRKHAQSEEGRAPSGGGQA